MVYRLVFAIPGQEAVHPLSSDRTGRVETSRHIDHSQEGWYLPSRCACARIEIWKKDLSLNKHARFILYINLNHLFVEGEGMSTSSEYTISGHIAQDVINDIADWTKDTHH